jgi:hypothetical protein
MTTAPDWSVPNDLRRAKNLFVVGIVLSLLQTIEDQREAAFVMHVCEETGAAQIRWLMESY